MFGLTKKEAAILKKLNTPIKIQDFLDTLPRNWEKNGDTCLSPRLVLSNKKAHCIEGALVAAAALWLDGQEPLVMDFRATRDDGDHVIALYKVNGRWGAISKTNHVGLRWRDPVYRTWRELAMSYFHEYLHDRTDRKTLRSFSAPINLKKFGSRWITAENNLFDLAGQIDAARHFPVAPRKNLRRIRPADRMERRANRLVEWKKSDPRT
ncbi:MAG TPA: hypothetical protein VMC41_00735 [Candidatus Nanoarchaeia archaeon]|nr:hypothetical protein [Candidatus Nanoarchaeia archaeon]